MITFSSIKKNFIINIDRNNFYQTYNELNPKKESLILIKNHNIFIIILYVLES